MNIEYQNGNVASFETQNEASDYEQNSTSKNLSEMIITKIVDLKFFATKFDQNARLSIS